MCVCSFLYGVCILEVYACSMLYILYTVGVCMYVVCTLYVYETRTAGRVWWGPGRWLLGVTPECTGWFYSAVPSRYCCCYCCCWGWAESWGTTTGNRKHKGNGHTRYQWLMLQWTPTQSSLMLAYKGNVLDNTLDNMNIKLFLFCSWISVVSAVTFGKWQES